MAPLDRFRSRAKPKLDAPKGDSGRGHTGSYIRSDETNSDLLGIRGLQTYDRMWRTDGDIRKTLAMMFNPIVAATWRVDPYGGEDAEPKDIEVAEAVQWALFEHLFFKGHLMEALRVTARSGFSIFEKVWELADYDGKPMYVLKALELRLPRTIQRWHQEGGTLTAVTQSKGNGGLVEIPAGDFVHYRFGIEGDNWEGESLLRPAYKHWRYKDTLELVEAISHERFAVGVPIVYPPESASSADLESAEDAVSGIRANEQGFIVAPGPHAEWAEKGRGWLFDILRPSGQPANIQDTLKYHSDRISAAMLEEFMRLGQSDVGARATADVQQDPFYLLCEGIASIVIEDTINKQVIPRLVDLNFDVDGYPTLKASLIDSTSLTELASFVGQLATAGAITPDPVLEEHLRDVADLPATDPNMPDSEETVPPPNEPTQPSDDNQDSQDSQDDEGGQILTLARQDRELREWERPMQLDRIESTIDHARASFEAAGRDAVVGIAQNVAAGKKPGDNQLEADLYAEMVGLFTVGRDTVREELMSQMADRYSGILLADEQATEEDKALQARADLAAGVVTAAVINETTRAKLRGGDLAQVQSAGELAGLAALRSESQQHAAAALNLGRTYEAERHTDQIEGARYTSILDGRRCAACAVADDDVLRRLDDPVRVARIPPNAGCLGGERCRCLEAFQLRDETPPLK